MKVQNKYHLVLNSLEHFQTPPAGYTNLYAGKWCFNTWREVLANSSEKIVVYHWMNDRSFLHDQEYLKNIYEQVLKNVSNWLNDLHSTTLSYRFWDIFIGEWLETFLHVYFDRWQTIRKIETEYPEVKVTITNSNETFEHAVLNDYESLYLSDTWNAMAFSDIIRSREKMQYQEIKESIKKGSTTSNNHVAPKEHFLDFFSRRNSILYLHTFLSFSDLLSVELLSGQALSNVMRFHRSHIDMPPYDRSRRTRKLKQDAPSDDFLDFIYPRIIEHFPVAYIEGFNTLLDFIKQFPVRKNPKAIVTAAVEYDDILSCFIAKEVENKTKLVRMQHGGYYGVGRNNFIEERELRISDKYITWGNWTDSHKAVVNGPQLKYKRAKVEKLDQKIVIILMTLPKYSKLAVSDAISDKFYVYLDQVDMFLGLFTPEMLAKTVVRGSFFSKRKENDLFKEKYPQIKFDNTSQIENLLFNALLVVNTYPSTTMPKLVSQKPSIPVVEMFDPSLFPLSEHAATVYAKMEDEGLFYPDLKKCASFIEQGCHSGFTDWWDVARRSGAMAMYKNSYAVKNNFVSYNTYKKISEIVSNSN